MMLAAINLTSIASVLTNANTEDAESHESGAWVVALDKNDNKVWTELSGEALLFFDLYTYTNWNYYDFTGDEYVKTYFVIDGVRYIVENYDMYSGDEYYSLVESNDYMLMETGVYYSMSFEYPYDIWISAQRPSGYWEDYLILKDKDGNEVIYHGDMYLKVNIALDKQTYGDSYVYFHFRRNYEFYRSYRYLGAEIDGLEPTPGVPFANKVINSSNDFKVPAGFNYVIGIFNDPVGGSYLYLLQGDPIQDEVTVTGDVNGDNSINISDVVLLIDFVLGKDPQQFNMNAADTNMDGNVDISDVVRLIDRILTGI